MFGVQDPLSIRVLWNPFLYSHETHAMIAMVSMFESEIDNNLKFF